MPAGGVLLPRKTTLSRTFIMKQKSIFFVSHGDDKEAMLSLLSDMPDMGHRENRLIAAFFLAECREPEITKKIDSLSDHKGWLTVKWVEKPSSLDKSIFEWAWESVGEITTTVDHEEV